MIALRKGIYTLIWSITLLQAEVCIAQDPDPSLDDKYTRLANIGTPSPNAASLGVYGQYPLGNFTGVPQINVPLYEINEGGYKLPISLNYNASGIKVNDIASWVGMGWSLDAGGLITRTVRGFADDMTPSAIGFLYYNFMMAAQPYNPGNVATGYNEFSDPFQVPLNLKQLRISYYDTEPDIFFYNFNGHAGKFIFSQGSDPATNTGQVPADQHKIHLVPYRDLDVKYSLVTASSEYGKSTLDAFTIKDEEGNTYLFDKKEIVTPFTIGSTFSSIDMYGERQAPKGIFDINDAYHSSWYLSKITTVLGKVITFNYDMESCNRRLPTTYSVRGLKYGTGVGCSGEPLQGNSYESQTPCVFENSYSITTQSLAVPRLTSIEGDDFRVLFKANEQRQDLAGSNALTAVEIYSKDINGNTALIKEFDLAYYYTQSAQENIPDVSGANLLPFDQGADKRLMLAGVTEKGADNLSKPPYQFTYNNTVPLPNRYSNKQDLWGYFNNSSCSSLIPNLYVYNTYLGSGERFSLFNRNDPTNLQYTFDGADRTTNADAILSGTLNKITFPTGGYTEFQFEPNSFFYYQNTLGGGLRLKKSTNYDGVDHTNDVIKEYTYTKSTDNTKSSGALFNLPVYAYTQNFPDISNVFGQNGSFPDQYSRAYLERCLVLGSEPNYTLSGYDGVNVGYSEITESIQGNGKTIKRFSTPAKYGDDNDDYYSDSYNSCDFNESGTCDALFAVGRTHTYYLPDCYGQNANGVYPMIDQTGISLGPNSFPFAPKMNYDWNRGLLLSEETYNNAGTIIRRSDNQYSVFTPGNAGPKYTYGLRQARMDNYYPYFTQYCLYVHNRYDVVNFYPSIAQVAKVLSEQDVTIYNNVGAAISKKTRYSYNYNSLLPSKTEISQSDGSSQVINNKYITDLNLTSSSGNPDYLGYQNLYNKHSLYSTVEEYEQKKYPDNSVKTVSGSFVTYNTVIPKPSGYYKLKVTSPLTTFTPSAVSPTGVTKDPAYRPVINFDSYDASGNILQQHKNEDVPHSYVWNYNNTLPIAEITNAVSGQGAYTSFEADGAGNWNIGSTARNAATGITGNASYTLNSDISKSNLTAPEIYVVSYWTTNNSPFVITGTINGYPVKGKTAMINGTSWTYYEHRITGQVTISLSGTGNIDELRLYPANAQMVTYAYTPLVGMTSKCDINNHITYYEYDSLGRLILVRDQDKNIVQRICYNYAGQPENCTPPNQQN